MMIMKLIPNVVTHLPLTAYYSITFLSLYVGKTGIKSCTVKIGDEHIEFSRGAEDETMLNVNGDPGNTPTHLMRSSHEEIVLMVPADVPDIDKEEILLHHFLSYSVPWNDSKGQN